jgi:hypothetical protein
MPRRRSPRVSPQPRTASSTATSLLRHKQVSRSYTPYPHFRARLTAAILLFLLTLTTTVAAFHYYKVGKPHSYTAPPLQPSAAYAILLIADAGPPDRCLTSVTYDYQEAGVEETYLQFQAYYENVGTNITAATIAIVTLGSAQPRTSNSQLVPPYSSTEHSYKASRTPLDLQSGLSETPLGRRSAHLLNTAYLLEIHPDDTGLEGFEWTHVPFDPTDPPYVSDEELDIRTLIEVSEDRKYVEVQVFIPNSSFRWMRRTGPRITFDLPYIHGVYFATPPTLNAMLGAPTTPTEELSIYGEGGSICTAPGATSTRLANIDDSPVFRSEPSTAVPVNYRVDVASPPLQQAETLEWQSDMVTSLETVARPEVSLVHRPSEVVAQEAFFVASIGFGAAVALATFTLQVAPWGGLKPFRRIRRRQQTSLRLRLRSVTPSRRLRHNPRRPQRPSRSR